MGPGVKRGINGRWKQAQVNCVVEIVGDVAGRDPRPMTEAVRRTEGLEGDPQIYRVADDEHRLLASMAEGNCPARPHRRADGATTRRRPSTTPCGRSPPSPEPPGDQVRPAPTSRPIDPSALTTGRVVRVRVLPPPCSIIAVWPGVDDHEDPCEASAHRLSGPRVCPERMDLGRGRLSATTSVLSVST